jgi:carboxymethylenebutenolidase
MSHAIRLDTAHGPIGAWRAGPADARIGVVLVQEIFGLNPHMRAVADRLGEAGFAVLAPALFDALLRDRGEPSRELGYDAEGVAAGRMLAEALGFERALDSIRAAAATLAEEGRRVAVLGFCWGGTLALLANSRLGLPCVDFYGGRSRPFLGEALRAPALFHFGERDPLIPPPDVEAHREAYPGAPIHLYPAGHGFHCDERADFEPASAALAMQRSHAFLRALADAP